MPHHAEDGRAADADVLRHVPEADTSAGAGLPTQLRLLGGGPRRLHLREHHPEGDLNLFYMLEEGVN